MDSVEAAAAWRRANLDPSWAKPAPRRIHEVLEQFLLRTPLASACDPQFLVAALLDAGFRDFTGKQSIDLAGIIIMQWMTEATRIIGDPEPLFYIPDWTHRPLDELGHELEALRDELLAG